jgi:hypothetical protein
MGCRIADIAFSLSFNTSETGLHRSGAMSATECSEGVPLSTHDSNLGAKYLSSSAFERSERTLEAYSSKPTELRKLSNADFKVSFSVLARLFATLIF